MSDPINQTDEQPQGGVQTMSDEDFFAARRETMGEDYPGDDAMRQFDREADAEWQQQIEADRAAEPAPAPEAEAASAEAQSASEAKEWNAGAWLSETFKDDPTFNQLSDADRGRLEAMANEKHAEFAGEIQDWAAEKGEQWSGELRDSLREGMDNSARLEGFFDSHLADGEFSAADKAALEEAAHGMTPAEAAGVARPIMTELREIHGELIDGVEMIVDHAVDDVHDIVEARAEMPGGDSEQVQKMLHDLEEAPAKIEDALNWEREQADIQWDKADDRLELIEAGTDPRDLPRDTDTYQADPNAETYETGEA